MVAGYFKKLDSENVVNNWTVNGKAGIDQKSMDRANQIIHEAGKHSEYYSSE